MGQFSVEIWVLPGALLSGNQRSGPSTSVEKPQTDSVCKPAKPAKSTPGIVEIGPNDALGAPRSLNVIKPARNYLVSAGLQLGGKSWGHVMHHKSGPTGIPCRFIMDKKPF